jgi:hypothetical protein
VLLLVDFVLIHTDRKYIVSIRVADFLKPLLARESQRAVSRQHHMWRHLHDPPCNTNRVDHSDNRGHCTRFTGCAVHDRCIKFNIASCIRCRTTACDIQTAGFHFSNGVLDNVDCARPGFKPGLASFGQDAQVIFNNRIIATRNGAGTAVQSK